MAPSSPRRSSRARTLNTQSQQSSGSSGTPGRLERTTRSVNKPSSGKSTPSASLSSEPPDDPDDTLLGRRRKRGREEEQERFVRNDSLEVVNNADNHQEEEEEDEDEAVRCICGSEEYPGRPPVDGPDAGFFSSIELTEDVTGFFVQCDICKVWQHGACVGIFSAESSPDEYFCEQCRKDLHKIHSASNGQRYSKYLPLNRASRTTSRATSITGRSPKLSASKTTRPSIASQASKRRSTMNSRDAAYDDEQLRRAIEASKEETTHDTIEHHHRRTKRGRSNSEENNTHAKRQRTSSRSVSPSADNAETMSRENSDEETNTRNGSKKPRQGRSHDYSEKDDKERARQEASSKRKVRAERRRTEDSDLSEELPLAITKIAASKSLEATTGEPVPTAMPVPGTPPTILPVTMNNPKRASRNIHKRGRGKNQYTKDRSADHEESPTRSTSRDITKVIDETIITSNVKSMTDQKHNSKFKSIGSNRMSMLDMKRRVAAIMDFISKTQVDLATEAPFNCGGVLIHGATSPRNPRAVAANSTSQREGVSDTLSDSFEDKAFKELSCIEMMDVLTRDMVKWQNQYS